MAKIGTPSRRETIFHQNAFWPQDGPNSRPEVPKRPEMASRRPRAGRKMGPNWLQGRPQDGPKRAPRLDETLIFEYRLCGVHSSLFSCVFKKTRLASTRRSFWASPWARNFFWGAPDGTSFSSWVPRRAQEAPRAASKTRSISKNAPRLDETPIFLQNERLVETRLVFSVPRAASKTRSSPKKAPRRDETLSLDIEKTCPPHNRSQLPRTLSKEKATTGLFRI